MVYAILSMQLSGYFVLVANGETYQKNIQNGNEFTIT